MLCPRQVSLYRRSWFGHERCTAILVALLMVLPHGDYDEENYVTVLEDIRAIIEEGRAMGAKNFFIGGDINIELKLDTRIQDPGSAPCFDKTWMRTWDHVPVVLKMDGRELRVKEEEGWAGVDFPTSERRPDGSREWMDDGQGGDLEETWKRGWRRRRRRSRQP